MKSFFLSVVLSSLFFAVNAQRNMQGRQFLNNKCQPHYLVLASPDKDIQKTPAIKRIEVVDLRPDTSRIGFFTENRRWKDIRFRSGLRQELQAYLNDLYPHPQGHQSLLVIIKKCWLFDTVLAKPNVELMKKVDKGRIVFRAEAFLQTAAGLAPYAYLDTVIVSKASAVDIARWRLPGLLEALMQKVSATDEATVLKRNRFYSLAGLDSLNNKRYAYAMDTAQVLRKGVYASLEEFRNNQPSILDYHVEKNAEGHMDLFLHDAAGQSYYSRTMWGYCDGEHCYAMMDGNLFLILPVDHAFYVAGSREYKIKQTKVPLLMFVPGAYLFGMEAVAETAIRRLSLFQLDVYTGLID